MDFFMLSNTILFRGITPEEIKNVLLCLGGKQKHFTKEETVYRAGEQVSALGIVLSGSVIIENNDVWGNKTVLDKLGIGKVFAETYACSEKETLMVDVVATEDTDILFLQTKPLLTLCPQTCAYHTKVIRNLVSLLAQKNLHLSHRMFYASSKSIRGRLLSYLSHQAAQNSSWEFTIPFNRQELADYLQVDRSALSNEISKMQKEGFFTVNKNQFSITLKEFF
ncbi:Crp/Fnr family transcriptional regulator [Treponema phagedenis]|uniref:Crp/Fnr family transcriptional regulator n=1 Tax=Treponema phagedenis TaxID=162 RepID=UPI000463A6C8|nr:Crp/Fnr family transcriptional regulator [Treponema phagedenis]